MYKLVESVRNHICPQSLASEVTYIYNTDTILENKVTFMDTFIYNITNTTLHFSHVENMFPKLYLSSQSQHHAVS